MKGEADVWVDQRTVNCIFRLIAFDYVLYGKKYSILTSFVRCGIFFSLMQLLIISYSVLCVKWMDCFVTNDKTIVKDVNNKLLLLSSFIVFFK